MGSGAAVLRCRLACFAVPSQQDGVYAVEQRQIRLGWCADNAFLDTAGHLDGHGQHHAGDNIFPLKFHTVSNHWLNQLQESP